MKTVMNWSAGHSAVLTLHSFMHVLAMEHYEIKTQFQMLSRKLADPIIRIFFNVKYLRLRTFQPVTDIFKNSIRQNERTKVVKN